MPRLSRRDKLMFEVDEDERVERVDVVESLDVERLWWDVPYRSIGVHCTASATSADGIVDALVFVIRVGIKCRYVAS